MTITKTLNLHWKPGLGSAMTANVYPRNGGAAVNASPLTFAENGLTPGLYQAPMIDVVSTLTYLVEVILGGSVFGTWKADLKEVAAFYELFGDITPNEIAAAAGSGAGSGVNSVLITVEDTDSNPLQNATVVFVLNGGEIAFGNTDVDGYVMLLSSNATVDVLVICNDYDGLNTTLVIPSTNPTYQLTRLTITPSTPPGVTGSFIAYDVNGIAEANVTCLNSLISIPGVGRLDAAGYATATSGDNGLIQFANLIVGATYQIKALPNGAAIPYIVPNANFSLPNCRP